MSTLNLKHRPLRIVLVGTSHPGNIGAVARAMKTMNLSELHLVNPKTFPHADATAMASGADDLLFNAHRWDTLEEAVAECGLVYGASARLRSLTWPVESPPTAAAKALLESAQHPVALVFGRERTGLTNDELALCHALVHIPSNPDFSSLNLAMAVQVMGYELMMLSQDPNRLAYALNSVARPSDESASTLVSTADIRGETGFMAKETGRGANGYEEPSRDASDRNDRGYKDLEGEESGSTEPGSGEPSCVEAVHPHISDNIDEKGLHSAIATSEQMNYFYQHLQQVMIDTGFLNPAAPKHLMRRLRRLFGRARPDTTELNILRGVLSAVDKYGKKS